MLKNKELLIVQFERISISVLSILSGIIVAYLAISGPLLLNTIVYKTNRSMLYQIQGQDLVNLILLSPLLIIGGILLLIKHDSYKYLLILTPIYLIYFAVSYILGPEWNNAAFTGNSEKYFYYFLFLIISSLLILLYTQPKFTNSYDLNFNKKPLILYTISFITFLSAFALVWVKGVNEVIMTGTTMDYHETPNIFWVIRCLDLGFTIPLAIISTYMLWTRPNNSIKIQFLVYGFFVSLATVVNAMAIFMYINDDPSLNIVTVIVFMILAIIAYTGFTYIAVNYKRGLNANLK